MIWKYQVDDPAEGWYNMIIGIYLHTGLGIYLIWSNDTIFYGDGLFQGYTAPMVDLHNYEFEKPNKKCMDNQRSH